MYLFLDVKRRRIGHEVRPVLLVLAAPNELRFADLDLAPHLKLRDLRAREPDTRAVPDDLRIEVRIALPDANLPNGVCTS